LKNILGRHGLHNLVLIITLALGLVACGASDKKLEKAIGDYIQKNPQALQKPIQDALKAQRPQRAPELPLEERIKKAIKVDVGDAPVEGPANAPITIVEFSDFQCPFCSRINPTIAQLQKDYAGKLRVAFRQHPLPFHPNAMPAAKASLAAKEQGKFWEMHKLLFANQQNLNEETIQKLAKEAGLNMDKFMKDWKSDKFNETIQADIKFAETNGASGTPALFINGVLIQGAQPVDAFKIVIDKMLGGGSAPAAGQAPIPAKTGG
jgi:protein-disulfide isomerase